MSSWKEYKLGEVISSNNQSIDKNYKFENIQYLDTGSITNNKIDGFQVFKISEAPSRAKRLVKHQDIVYSTVRPIQRHFGFIENPKENLVVSTGFSVIETNQGLAYPKFVYYFLSSDETVEILDVIAEASTSAYPSLKPSDIENLDISLPSLEEQKAIAEVLSSLDNKIALLHRQNKTLEDLAQTLFRQWFIEEVKDEWEVGVLGDLGRVITGKTPSTSNDDFWGEDIPFITPTDFKNYNKYAFTADRSLSILGKDKVKNSVIPKNSILVTCIGSDMGKVVITQNECVTNQQINSLVLSNDNLRNEYVFQYLKSIYPLLRAIALGGTTMPIINKTDFENIEILLPSNQVLEEFNKITLPFNEKIILNTQQIKTLENLRDTLLPKLLNGEVRVEI